MARTLKEHVDFFIRIYYFYAHAFVPAAVRHGTGKAKRHITKPSDSNNLALPSG